MTVEQAAARMYAAHDALQAIDKSEDIDAYIKARVAYADAKADYDAAYERKVSNYAATVRKS